MKKNNKSFLIDTNLVRDNIKELYQQFKKEKTKRNIKEINLKHVENIDSAGVAFLEYTQSQLDDLKFTNVSSEIQKAIDTFQTSKTIRKETSSQGFFEKFGGNALQAKEEFISALYLASDVFYWSIKDLFNTDVRQENSVINQSVYIGVNAVGIIGLLSFILGVILALQFSVQLRNFGAEIYIADLMGISMVRELGPMMTAIIVAGRSGSSFASEIGTMKISEELDALKAMGINPLRFIVVPKFIAITIVMPLLTTLSTVLGILAGLIIAANYLKISAYSFLYELFNYITFEDEIIGISKSIFFAWVIVIIGVHYGLQVEGGSEGVGKATTKAVVASIFAVIILDAFFSLSYII